MTPNERNLLDIMIEDMERADPLYRPTSFWIEAIKIIIAELEKASIEDFRGMASSLLFFVPSYGFSGWSPDDDKYRRVVDFVSGITEASPKAVASIRRYLSGESDAYSDYRVYLSGDTDVSPFIDRSSESQVGNPREQFVFQGRRFSRSFLNYLLGLTFLKRHIERETISTVLEIGGGYGTLGEILCSDERNNIFYMDVDIPPTAYFATYYLRRVLGSRNVISYADARESATCSIAHMSIEKKAAVLCPWQLPDIEGEVDLFVNFISFQEMEPPSVENYLGNAKRLNSRFVLLRNLKEGKQKRTPESPVGVETPVLSEDYNRFLNGYTLVAAQTVPFGLLTVDGFHSELRLYKRAAC